MCTSAHSFLIRGGSSCSLAALAPHQDLKLVNNIKSFANVDPAALKAFSRHTWYISGKFIPLALWDEDVTYEEKNLLADSINASQCSTSSAGMEFTKRCGNGFGKPELPDVTARQHLSLSQFATADSTMFFRILLIPSTFLAKRAMHWKNDEDYALGSEILSGLKVCNYSAERLEWKKTSKITCKWSKRTEGKSLTFEITPSSLTLLCGVLYCSTVFI